MYKAKIGVVYLCRANEKRELFCNFVNSYKKFPENCNHELIIIFKGFQDHPPSYLIEIKTIFEGLEYQSIFLPDTGFDIGAYLAAAKVLYHNYLYFFNTHTTIVANGWLNYLYNALNHDNVGLVGTTASYESSYKSAYYQWVVAAIDPKSNKIKQFRRYFKFKFKNIFNTIIRKTFFSDHVPFEDSEVRHFPNPYIRSNAFMISRELLLDLFGDYNVRTKEDACKFESGSANLTHKIFKLGLKTLIVGKNGIAYDVVDWPNSNTFRLGDQANLLTNDNQTRYYDNCSQEEKLLCTWISWGDNAICFKDKSP